MYLENGNKEAKSQQCNRGGNHDKFWGKYVRYVTGLRARDITSGEAETPPHFKSSVLHLGVAYAESQPRHCLS
jgi:hypothetical protein